jgi:predicted phage terminase large subunit-like protein
MLLTPRISKKQSDFLQSDKYLTVFRGGLGAGKTRVLCHSAIQSAIKNRIYLLTSFSYTALTDTVMETLIELLETDYKGLRYSKTNSTGRMNVFINRGKIWLRTGSDPDSLRGPNVDDIGIDEAREFKNGEILNQLMARARRSENPKCYLATTPNGKDWVYKLSDRDDCNLITQTTFENPFLPKGYGEKLASKYTSQYARQELYGEIVEMGSGIINPIWFKKVEGAICINGVRFWDLAVSIKTYADFSAGSLCSIDSREDFYIHDIKRVKLEYPDLRELIIKTAETDGMGTIIGIEEAGQQLGFIQDLMREPRLRGYTIQGLRPKGDKLNRLMPWASRAEAGKVFLCRGPWNENFVEECSMFTADDRHEHDDQVDSVSGAYSVLNETSKYFMARGRF